MSLQSNPDTTMSHDSDAVRSLCDSRFESFFKIFNTQNRHVTRMSETADEPPQVGVDARLLRSIILAQRRA